MVKIGQTVLRYYGLGAINGRAGKPEDLVCLRIAVEMACYKRPLETSSKLIYTNDGINEPVSAGSFCVNAFAITVGPPTAEATVLSAGKALGV